MLNSIKNPIFDENQSVYFRQGSLLLCAYKEQQSRTPVRVLSTSCKAEITINRKRYYFISCV